MPKIQHESRKVNTYQYERGPSQRAFVVHTLRQAGAAGVGKLHFVQGTGPCNGRVISQIAARIFELEKAGFRIDHRRVEGSDFVTFVLIGEPSCDQPTQLNLMPKDQSASKFAQREMGAL